MPTKQKIRNNFSEALEKALIERYKKLPSAAFLAKEFNIRAKDIYTIRQETARKWLRGLAIPELDKLLVLHIWLGLDLNSIGCYEEGLLEKKVIDLVGEISSYEISSYEISSAEISLLDKTKTLKNILLKTINEIGVVENKIKNSSK